MMNDCTIPPTNCVYVAFSQHMTQALKRLNTTLSNSFPQSVYVYDLVDQQTVWATYPVATLLGYSANDIHLMGATGLASLIHPDDIQRVSDHYQRFVTLQSDEIIAITYRMKKANNQWCSIRSKETPLITADNGSPLQILGVIEYNTQTICPNIKQCSLLDLN